MKDIQERWCCF